MPVTPKRLTKGVSSVGADKALGMYGRMDPTKYIYVWEDFIYVTKSVTDYIQPWFATTSQADGTITKLVNTAGGVVELNVQDSTDYVGLQMNNEAFVMSTGKAMWMGCRVKFVSDATEPILRIGLSDIETDIAPTRGVWFYKADAVTTWIAEVFDTASIVTVNPIGTAVANTWMKLELYFDGVDTFRVYVDDAYVGTMTTTAFPTSGLTPSIHFSAENDHATTNKTQIDYIYAALER